MRSLPASVRRGLRRRAMCVLALAPFLALAAGPATAAAPAGQYRLFLEGEAGVRNDGDYGGSAQAGSRDQAVGRAGLNLQLSYDRQRLQLALGYSPSYERGLSRPEQLSGVTHRLDFGLLSELSRRLKLSVHEQLFSSPTLALYSPNQPDANVAPRDGDQLVHAFDAQLDSAVSRRVSLRAGVSQGVRFYRGSGLADSREFVGRLGAGFAVGRDQSIEVAADAGRYDYGDLGDADVRSFGLAWSAPLGRSQSSRLRLEGGAYSVDSTRRSTGPEGPVFEGSSDQGWRGGVQLSQTRRAFNWNVGLSHDVSPGAGLGRAAEADNAFLGIARTLAGRRLTLAFDANGSRQRNLSEDRLATVPGDSPGLTVRNDLTRYVAGTASASWSFAPGFRVYGGYSRVWQRSEVEPFPDLSFGRYFLNFAFRLYSLGDTPREPERLGEPTDEEPDSQ